MWVQSLGREDPPRRKWQPTPVFLGFPGGSDGKDSAYNAGDLSSIPGLGRSPGGGYDNQLLVSYSPWGLKELDMTEHVRTRTHTHTHTHTHTLTPAFLLAPSRWVRNPIWGAGPISSPAITFVLPQLKDSTSQNSCFP